MLGGRRRSRVSISRWIGAGVVVALGIITSCTSRTRVVHEGDDDGGAGPSVPGDGGAYGDDDDGGGSGGSGNAGGKGGTGVRGGTGGRGGSGGEGGASPTGGTFPTGGTIPIGGTTPGGSGGAGGSVGKGGAGGASAGSGGNGGATAGAGSGGGGAGGTGGTVVCGHRLTGYLRDFQPTWMGESGHPDFEPHVTKPSAIDHYNEVETGIVNRVLGASGKPLYAGGTSGTNTTNGATYFPSWFTNLSGVNVGTEYSIELTDPDGDGTFTFDQSPWLPIDDGATCPFMPQTPCLLGNSRNYPTHNYAYTFELHVRFVHREGAFFTFTGDDDAWIFVNYELRLDLGGIHQQVVGHLDLDSLGLVRGNTYTLDLFRAERHVTASNFRIDTNVEFANCGYILNR